MLRRAFKPEQSIKKLREVEALISQGSSIGEASGKIGVTEQTDYRWRRECGSGCSSEGGGTVCVGTATGEGWVGLGVSAGGCGVREAVQAPANITTATRPNTNIFVLI